MNQTNMHCSKCNAVLTEKDIVQKRCVNCDALIDFDSTDDSNVSSGNSEKNKTLVHEDNGRIDQDLFCSECGEPLRSNAKYCHKCGSKRKTITSSYCPKCNTVYETADKYCEYDGTKLKKSSDIPDKPWLGFWYVYLYASLMVLGAISSIILLIVLDSSLAVELGINRFITYSLSALAIVSVGLIFRSRSALIINIILMMFGVVGWIYYMAEPSYSLSQNSSGLGFNVFWSIYFIKNRAQFYRW